MKTMIVLDTETTGLIQYERQSSDPSQPRITQLAAELCVEETGETLASINFLIRPDGWTIPPNLQELTGITMERAMDCGVPIKLALASFFELWVMSDMRVAHNEPFDMRMIRIEAVRDAFYSGEMVGEQTFADYWKAAPKFCTMASSTKIVNASRPADARKKTANLSEAYEHFTGKRLEGAHNAQVDIMACKAVFYGIRNHLTGVVK